MGVGLFEIRTAHSSRLVVQVLLVLLIHLLLIQRVLTTMETLHLHALPGFSSYTRGTLSQLYSPTHRPRMEFLHCIIFSLTTSWFWRVVMAIEIAFCEP